MIEPEELARKLEEHPDHSGCCPVCRRAQAETWAALQAITQAVGAMLAGKGGKVGPIAALRLLIGAGRKGKPSPADNGDFPGEPEAGMASPSAPGPRRTKNPNPPPVEGAEVHSHPELGWEDAWNHAHLLAGDPHTHTADGYKELEVADDE